MKYSASMDFLFLKPSVDRMESTGASAGSYLYAHARCVIMHASVCVCACVCVCLPPCVAHGAHAWRRYLSSPGGFVRLVWTIVIEWLLVRSPLWLLLLLLQLCWLYMFLLLL